MTGQDRSGPKGLRGIQLQFSCYALKHTVGCLGEESQAWRRQHGRSNEALNTADSV